MKLFGGAVNEWGVHHDYELSGSQKTKFQMLLAEAKSQPEISRWSVSWVRSNKRHLPLVEINE